MKIENRVEVLEHELKILKNEIQNTLMEIREQVLIHYYPELRAEDEPLRAKPVPARANAGSKPERPSRNSTSSRAANIEHTAQFDIAARTNNVQPFSDVFLQDLGLDAEDDFDDIDSELDTHAEVMDDREDELEYDVADDEDADAMPAVRALSTAPKTREVVLQQLKQAPNAPKSRVKPAAANRPPTRRNIAALATWVGDSVAKVGKERTIQVVETYSASGGTITAEIKTSLLQLISFANDAEPTSPVGNQETMALMVALDQLLSEA